MPTVVHTKCHQTLQDIKMIIDPKYTWNAQTPNNVEVCLVSFSGNVKGVVLEKSIPLSLPPDKMDEV